MSRQTLQVWRGGFKCIHNVFTMLVQPNTESQALGGFATLSSILSPNNRFHISLKPFTKYHRQGKPRSSSLPAGINVYADPDEIASIENYIKWADSLPVDPETGEIVLPDSHTPSPPPPLGVAGGGYLASLPNCANENHPPLPPRKIFTRLARQTILDAAGALEKSGYQPKDFYFFTGTLPGSSPAACEMFARYSRQFLDSLKKSLRRFKKNSEDEGLYLTFNCWEWQLRKKAGLVPALHLHLVVVCPDEEKAANLPEFLKTKWFDLLDYYSEKSGVSLYEKHQRLGGGQWTKEKLEQKEIPTSKTVRCEKSPANYLSKYVGKGSLSADSDFQDRFKNGKMPLYYPSSWWSISDKLRTLIKEHSFRFSVRLPLAIAREKFDEISEFLSDCANLMLKKFSPSFAPDCQYQSIYIHGEKYQEISDLMYEIFNKYAEQYNTQYDESSGYAKLPVLKEVALDWLMLPENYSLYTKFMIGLPYYQTNGQVDLMSNYMREKAAQFVGNLKFSNRFN
jgi:hypothetical protein